MTSINLYITKQAHANRNAGIARLEQGSYCKVIAKCFEAAIPFESLFDSAIEKLTRPCQVNLFTNCRAFDVNCCVMKENMKGRHQVVFRDKEGKKTIDWLKFVAAECCLLGGVDEFLVNEAMGEVLV